MSANFESAVIVGGGTMGAGISQLFLEKSMSVVLVEIDEGRARHSLAQIRNGIESKFRHTNPTSTAEELEDVVASSLSRFSYKVGLPGRGELFPDIAIETVYEDSELKARILQSMQNSFPKCRLFASNTSSLSIELLAGQLEKSDIFIGMHFFNPVPRSSLIELVKSKSTSSDCIDEARAFTSYLDKESILVRDSPGFATSRLGVVLGLEAIRMLEEGVASAEDIDKGMVLGYKLPIGPLRLTDLVGLDVRLAIAEYLEKNLGERFAAPSLLRQKVANGELGKKSGQGFYQW